MAPEDGDSPDARILVWDDGESMDFEGLKELWLVAETQIRDPQRERKAERRERLPVGKFGLGSKQNLYVTDIPKEVHRDRYGMKRCPAKEPKLD